MKVVFLDFDGVVNRFDEPESLRKLSPSCVEVLNMLIERTDAKIVITSTWRRVHGMADLRQILVNAGFKFPRNVIGKTPCGGARRGTEIEEWLKVNNGLVERFVILDDDTDMGSLLDRLIRTDSDTGLTVNDVEKAISLLA